MIFHADPSLIIRMIADANISARAGAFAKEEHAGNRDLLYSWR